MTSLLDRAVYTSSRVLFPIACTAFVGVMTSAVVKRVYKQKLITCENDEDISHAWDIINQAENFALDCGRGIVYPSITGFLMVSIAAWIKK